MAFISDNYHSFVKTHSKVETKEQKKETLIAWHDELEVMIAHKETELMGMIKTKRLLNLKMEYYNEWGYDKETLTTNTELQNLNISIQELQEELTSLEDIVGRVMKVRKALEKEL